MSADFLEQRAAGILLHPTSLPGGEIGTLGREAYRFVDWLASAGQSFWQILPLVAVDEGGSPYNGLSAMAGNPLLVDLGELEELGLVEPEPLPESGAEGGGGEVGIDFGARTERVYDRLSMAFDALEAGGNPELAAELAEYRSRNAYWLEDFALFRALRRATGSTAWVTWPRALRRREPDALAAAREEQAAEVGRIAFQQFIFDRQWSRLRAYAHSRHVRVIGDIPIFVAHDSADVWANQALFMLDEDGRAEVVSGVPPDYFSETGQRWGNPLYRWDAMRENGFSWWVDRFRRTLEWVDVVRVDHFRGFESYWRIPAEEETAVHGEWCTGPGAELFHALRRRLGDLPLIAEDLGLITRGVEELRDDLGFPGMRVLQFAFDGNPENPHLPENYIERTVAYTGTHDNDTLMGWWEGATESERMEARGRMGGEGEGEGGDEEEVRWALMRMIADSRANLAVVPMQDPLGLGADARMNTPGTTAGNWIWRLRAGECTGDLASRLRLLAEQTGRSAGPNVGSTPDEEAHV
jgi:4-alpha-glucanotransferase